MEVVPARRGRARWPCWPPTRSRPWCAARPEAVLGLATGVQSRCRRTPSSSGGTAPAPRRRTTRSRSSCSTSTSACPPGTRRPTAPPSPASSPTTSASTTNACTGRTRTRPVCRRPGRATRRRSGPPAASTCRCSGSAATGTSPSTSPARRWRPLTRIKTLTDADPPRQRPLLRLARRGAAARAHPGARHHPAGPAPAAGRPTGAAKAAAVAAAVEGPLAASCPASVLQLHPHVTRAARRRAPPRGCARGDHYREVYAAKPEWQGL